MFIESIMVVVLRTECTRRGPSGFVILVLPFHVAPCTHLRGVCHLALCCTPPGVYKEEGPRRIVILVGLCTHLWEVFLCGLVNIVFFFKMYMFVSKFIYGVL